MFENIKTYRQSHVGPLWLMVTPMMESPSSIKVPPQRGQRVSEERVLNAKIYKKETITGITRRNHRGDWMH